MDVFLRPDKTLQLCIHGHQSICIRLFCQPCNLRFYIISHLLFSLYSKVEYYNIYQIGLVMDDRIQHTFCKTFYFALRVGYLQENILTIQYNTVNISRKIKESKNFQCIFYLSRFGTCCTMILYPIKSICYGTNIVNKVCNPPVFTEANAIFAI